jgi:hypothetical protein
VRFPKPPKLPRLPKPPDPKQVLEAPLNALRRRPGRTAGIAAGLVVVLFLAELGHAQARLHHRRAQLDDARAQLTSTRDEVADNMRSRDRATSAGEQVRQGVDRLVDETTWLVGARHATEQDTAKANAQRADVDVQRVTVSAASGETRACLDGVASAVDATRRGDDHTAVGALDVVADACQHALATATGALFPYDFADPFVLRAGGRYYAYSTNAGAGDVQVISSPDLEHWHLEGNAMAALPGWAQPGATWAPAVVAWGDHYVAYYTARERSSRLQCISRAVGPSPAGPFLDDSEQPLVCQRDRGGSIDPSPFVDRDGRLHLLWKSERQGAPATLWSQELRPDGKSLVGTPAPLLSVDRSWEHGVVEAPSMVFADGNYLLLYSAADWSSRSYTFAYATCAGPRGPCLKPADGRLLRSGSALAGPGGAEAFRDAGGGLRVVYHAYTEPDVGYPHSRYVHLARLRVSHGRVTLG